MERIVQLSQKDYDELYEKANLNEEKIENKAVQYWDEKGLTKLKISLDIRENYKGDYYLYCNSYLCHLVMDSRFEIDPNIADKFSDYVEKYVLSSMEETYGKAIYLTNKANERERSLDKMLNISWFFILSGWGSFIGCLMYLIFGS